MTEPQDQGWGANEATGDGTQPETPTGVPPVPGPPPGWAEQAGEDEPPISPAVLNPE